MCIKNYSNNINVKNNLSKVKKLWALRKENRSALNWPLYIVK